MIQQWHNVQMMVPHNWTCGLCGQMVAGNLGYFRNTHPQIPAPQIPAHQIGPGYPRILICPHCDKPTYFEGNMQVPGAAYGAEVDHLPLDVGGLYKEARNCISVAAYTASVLATRKLLMNVSVSQGAPPNDKFQNYVTFLSSKGFVPPNAKGWVDHIRDKGNEATHEIPAIGPDDAKDLLTFMEMILKLVFEFPKRVPGHGGPAVVGP